MMAEGACRFRRDGPPCTPCSHVTPTSLRPRNNSRLSGLDLRKRPVAIFAHFLDHPQIVFGIRLFLFIEGEVLRLLIQLNREKQQIPNSANVSLSDCFAPSADRILP